MRSKGMFGKATKRVCLALVAALSLSVFFGSTSLAAGKYYDGEAVSHLTEGAPANAQSTHPKLFSYMADANQNNTVMNDNPLGVKDWTGGSSSNRYVVNHYAKKIASFVTGGAYTKDNGHIRDYMNGSLTAGFQVMLSDGTWESWNSYDGTMKSSIPLAKSLVDLDLRVVNGILRYRCDTCQNYGYMIDPELYGFYDINGKLTVTGITSQMMYCGNCAPMDSFGNLYTASSQQHRVGKTYGYCNGRLMFQEIVSELPITGSYKWTEGDSFQGIFVVPNITAGDWTGYRKTGSFAFLFDPGYSTEWMRTQRDFNDMIRYLEDGRINTPVSPANTGTYRKAPDKYNHRWYGSATINGVPVSHIPDNSMINQFGGDNLYYIEINEPLSNNVHVGFGSHAYYTLHDYLNVQAFVWFYGIGLCIHAGEGERDVYQPLMHNGITVGVGGYGLVNDSRCGRSLQSSVKAVCADCGDYFPNLLQASEETLSSIRRFKMGSIFGNVCFYNTANATIGGEEIPYLKSKIDMMSNIHHYCIESSFNNYTLNFQANNPNPAYLSLQDKSLGDYFYQVYTDGQQVAYAVEGSMVDRGYDGAGNLLPIPTTASRNTVPNGNELWNSKGYIWTGWELQMPDGKWVSLGRDVTWEQIAKTIGETNDIFAKDRAVINLRATWYTPVRDVFVVDGDELVSTGYNPTTLPHLAEYKDVAYTESVKIADTTDKNGTLSLVVEEGGVVETPSIATVKKFVSYTAWQGNEYYRKNAGIYDNATREYYNFSSSEDADYIVSNYAWQSVVLPQATKENFAFLGWYLDEACTMYAGTTGSTYTPKSESEVLYALFREEKMVINASVKDAVAGTTNVSWYYNNTNFISNNIAYKIYRPVPYNLPEKNILSSSGQVSASEVYQSSTSDGKYVVPYTGLYNINLQGAAGGSVTVSGKTADGGKGASYDLTMFLRKGDILEYKIANKHLSSLGNDYTAGKGKDFTKSSSGSAADGGAASILFLTRGGETSVVAVAGGGGGAGLLPNGTMKNGGDAVEVLSVSGTKQIEENTEGLSAAPGGGGGYHSGSYGGLAHMHENNCYQSGTTYAEKSWYQGFTPVYYVTHADSGWARSFGVNEGQTWITGAGPAFFPEKYNVSIHNRAMTYGDYVAMTSPRLAVANADTLKFVVHTGYWGGENEEIEIQVRDQNNNIFYQTIVNRYTTYTSMETVGVFHSFCGQNHPKSTYYFENNGYSGRRVSNGHVGCQDYRGEWGGVGAMDWSELYFVIDLPEGVTGVSIYAKNTAQSYITGDTVNDAWELSIHVSDVCFDYDYLDCDYVSSDSNTSYASTGGSCWFDEVQCVSAVFHADNQSTDGKITIQGADFSLSTETSTVDVNTPDKEAPDKPVIDDSMTLSQKASGEDTVDIELSGISWSESVDYGTAYEYRGETWDYYGSGQGQATDHLRCSTKENAAVVVTSGLDCYSYSIYLDDELLKEGTTQDSFLPNMVIIPGQSNTKDYSYTVRLEVYAKDRAGNTSAIDTRTIEINESVPPVHSHLIGALGIPNVSVSNNEGVYRNGDTYYVKADGMTAVRLTVEAVLATVNQSRITEASLGEGFSQGLMVQTDLLFHDAAHTTIGGNIGNLLPNSSFKVEEVSDRKTKAYQEFTTVSESETTVIPHAIASCLGQENLGCLPNHEIRNKGKGVTILGDKTTPLVKIGGKTYSGEGNAAEFDWQDYLELTIEVSDTGSGIKKATLASYGKMVAGRESFLVRTTSCSIQASFENEGVYTYMLMAEDNVGNLTTVEITVQIDNSKPSIVDITSGLEEEDVIPEDAPFDPEGTPEWPSTSGNVCWQYNWVNTNRTLEYIAKDDLSGLASLKLYQSDANWAKKDVLSEAHIGDNSRRTSLSYTVQTEGITRYIVEATDERGHTTNAYVVVRIDKSAPSFIDRDAESVGVTGQPFVDLNGRSFMTFGHTQIDLEKFTMEEATKAMETLQFDNLFIRWEVVLKDLNAQVGGRTAVSDSSGVKRASLYIYDKAAFEGEDILMETKEMDSSRGVVTTTVKRQNSKDVPIARMYDMNLAGNGNLTMEGTCPFAPKDRYLTRYFDLSVNTFQDFPYSAELGWRIVVEDNAGNIFVREGEDTIRNFLIKAVCRAVGDDAYNVEGKDGISSTAYFKTGEFGYLEVWTIGYVDTLELDFSDGDIGGEAYREIARGALLPKYALGVHGSAGGERLVPIQKEPSSPPMVREDGVPFATHYVYSASQIEDFLEEGSDNEKGWLSNGTMIRIPPSYQLALKGELDKWGNEIRIWEYRVAHVYGYKDGNTAPPAKAPYVIWDESGDDVHYRIIHGTLGF